LEHIQLDSEDGVHEVLLQNIASLNKRKDIHGILVQLPLPRQIHLSNVMESIDPKKDVDG